MAVLFDKQTKTFRLETKHSSYIFHILDNGILEHLYYGDKLSLKDDLRDTANHQIYSWALSKDGNRVAANSNILLECSFNSDGDYREPTISFSSNVDTRFIYLTHDIYKGHKEIPDLPFARNNKEAETLEINLINENKDIKVYLFYVVYENSDVITRYIKIENNTKLSLFLNKANSMCLDFNHRLFDYISLYGMYNYERADIVRYPLHKGFQGSSSNVGISSHYVNPFFALVSPKCKENKGEAYGFNLIYSGNFKNSVEVDRLEQTRVNFGVNDETFYFELKPSDIFYTPEAVMTYSKKGLNGMSQNFHSFINEHIIEKRANPIVYNSWEGHFLDINEELIPTLIKEAKSIGADTLVIDDGWFRQSKNHAKGDMGDWEVDTTKFPHGLKPIVKQIHDNGLKFGIWIEPEVLSLDSKLYKQYPHIISSANITPLVGRDEYVIDLTYDEHVKSVVNNVINALKELDVDYVKWDFNRYPGDLASFYTPKGEVSHRQTIGIYKLLKLVKEALPNVFFEGCAGGGGRFDLGILYYCPLIWASDNTDPYNRIYIQYGTSIAYPPSVISCHFTKGECISGKPSTFEFRYQVASFGVYGYELDLSKNKKEDLEKLNKLTKEYKLNKKLIVSSDLYRLVSPLGDKYVSYIQVSKDKTEALFTFLQINATGLYENVIVKLVGLNNNYTYQNSLTGEKLSGKALMNVGVRVKDLYKGKSGSGVQIHFVRVE